MTLSALTNVFIGICLTFASVALLVSTATEGLASLLKLRASTLLDGLKSMLNAQTPSTLRRLLPPMRRMLPGVPAGDGMTGAKLLQGLLNHAAINPRGPGDDAQKSADQAPSYIAPDHFAAALIDVVSQGHGLTADGISAAIGNISDPQLKQLLQGIEARCGGDLQKMQAEIATWFDAAMDRVGGDYKRYAQLWNFLIGLVVAVLFNIDAIAIIHALLTQPNLAASIQITATDYSHVPDLPTVQGYGLPIGWAVSPDATLWSFLASGLDEVRSHSLVAANHVAGWFITALASLFGAPFWFDTLQRFVQLRGTGDKPAAPAQPVATAPPAVPAAAGVVLRPELPPVPVGVANQA